MPELNLMDFTAYLQIKFVETERGKSTIIELNAKKANLATANSVVSAIKVLLRESGYKIEENRDPKTGKHINNVIEMIEDAAHYFKCRITIQKFGNEAKFRAKLQGCSVRGTVLGGLERIDEEGETAAEEPKPTDAKARPGAPG